MPLFCRFIGKSKGLEPEGAWQGAGGALQPEAASAAAEVESLTVHQNRREAPAAPLFGLFIGKRSFSMKSPSSRANEAE